MSIKQYGGVFGRNPTFNKVTADSVETNLLTVDRLSSDGTLIAFEKNGSTVGQIAVANSNNLTIGGMVAGHSGMQFGTGRIIPETAGVQSNGTVDLGQNSGRFKDAYLSGNVIVASGKGIDFSATAGTGTSELLDDYEEGTWTPTLIGSTSGSATLTVTSSSYVKVGSLVTASAYLSAINLNADDIVGNMYIDGLPFSVGTSNLQGVSITYQSLSTTFPVISGRIVSSTIRLNQDTRNLSLARSDSTGGTGAAIMISATYRA
tara:strand:- start:86 stop:871 length:786 start_codon:yes stop_codon:yes gene_type:complete